MDYSKILMSVAVTGRERYDIRSCLEICFKLLQGSLLYVFRKAVIFFVIRWNPVRPVLQLCFVIGNDAVAAHRILRVQIKVLRVLETVFPSYEILEFSKHRSVQHIVTVDDRVPVCQVIAAVRVHEKAAREQFFPFKGFMQILIIVSRIHDGIQHVKMREI